MKPPRGFLRASQIARLLGVSRPSIFKRAQKEGWPWTEMPTNGGKAHFYKISTIPEPIRSRLLRGTPPIERPKTASKIERAVERLNRAAELLTQLAAEGFERKEINRILNEAKEALRAPRDETKKGEPA